MSDYSNNDIKDILNKYIKYLCDNITQYPVSGLDYSSLYPSLIMAYNLSPEYLILDEDYKNQLQDKGYNIHNIKFEYNYENYLGEKHSKDIIGWTVRHNEENKENTMFGLYPTILRDLFKQRAEMKKELAIYKDKKEHIEKYEKDYINNKDYKECLFKLKYCDTKQKALKVFMNTFYGEMGNKNSPLFQLPLAGGVTSAGQYNLLLIKKYVESLDHKVYYGDSVIGETPVLIRFNKKEIKLMNIEDLGWNDNFIWKYHSKEIIYTNLKLFNLIEVYTENCWTKIKKMIRHKTNKKLYRIRTSNSIVVVTEDHSLLNSNKEKITPDECNLSTKLLQWDYINLKDFQFKIDYSLKYYLSQNYIYCYTQIKAQMFYLYLSNLGYNIKLSVLNANHPIYKIEIVNDKIENANAIQSIEYLGYSNNYVYDLETESHHFAAGIGQLVVHNTDSLYISCPSSYYKEIDKKYYTNQINKEEYNTELVNITFKAIEDIKVKVNNYLYKDNGTKYLKMSYEEVLYPLAFLSKKKYFGIPHESLANFKPKDLFIRGLEVKKRGVSELLKIICMDLMWKSMDLNNTKTLKELVIDKIKEIFSKKWNLEDFIQTGVWKPEKKNITLNNFVQRMKQENKMIPTPGERFSYVIIKRYPYKYDYKGRQIELSKADKMEYLDIVKKYNYDIDLKYYFDNQLTGQFARLISYENEFEHKLIDNQTQQVIIDDDKTLNNCKKYILKLVDQFNNTFTDRKYIFKDLYKSVNSKYKETKNNIYDKKYNIILNTNCKIKENSNIYHIIIDNINSMINQYDLTNLVNNTIKNTNKEFIKNNKSDNNNLDNKNNKQDLLLIYNNKQSSYYMKIKYKYQTKFNQELDELLNLLSQYDLQDKLFNIDNMNLINITNYIREQNKLDDICNSNIKNEEVDLIINDQVIEENLNNKDLYINIDNNILSTLYNKYINLISLKKNILIHDNIYHKLYKNIFSNAEYIQKPRNLDKLQF
jgi:DNA polymerase elongation subunit (family B)